MRDVSSSSGFGFLNATIISGFDDSDFNGHLSNSSYAKVRISLLDTVSVVDKEVCIDLRFGAIQSCSADVS